MRICYLRILTVIWAVLMNRMWNAASMYLEGVVLPLLLWIKLCYMTDRSHEKQGYIPKRIRGKLRNHQEKCLSSINGFLEDVATSMVTHPWFKVSTSVINARHVHLHSFLYYSTYFYPNHSAYTKTLESTQNKIKPFYYDY
jgi:hypothetical protein